MVRFKIVWHINMYYMYIKHCVTSNVILQIYRNISHLFVLSLSVTIKYDYDKYGKVF